MSKPPRSRGKDDSTSTIDTLHLIARTLDLTGSASLGGNLTATGSISGSSLYGATMIFTDMTAITVTGSLIISGSSVYGKDAKLTNVTAETITGSSTISGSNVNSAQYLLSGSDVSAVLAHPEHTSSYIVWVEGGIYYAKNGHTGEIQFSGTDAVQSAMDAMTQGGTIHFKEGNFDTGVAFTPPANVNIEGEGINVTNIRTTAATINAITIGAAADQCSIRDLTITSTVTKTSGSALSVAGLNFRAKNVWVRAHFNGLTLSESLGVYEDVDIREMEDLGSGITITGGNDHFFNRVEIYGLNGAKRLTYGFYIRKTGGTWIDNSDVVQCGTGMYLSPSDSAAQSLDALFVSNSAFDGNNYGIACDGAPASTITDPFFVNCWTVSNGFDGVALTNVVGASFFGHRCWANNGHGFRIGSLSTDWRILGGIVTDNDHDNVGGEHGIFIDTGVGNGVISGLRVGNNIGITTTSGSQAYGIYYTGGGGYVIIHDNDLRGNVVGGAFIGAADTGLKITNNNGFVTENRGIAYITAQSGSFAHGLASTPTTVFLTPSGSASTMYMGALGWYLSGSAGIWVQQTGSGVVPVNWDARLL